MWLCFLLQGAQPMGWVLPIFIGMSWHLPYPEAVPHCPGDPTRALFPHSITGVGWCQKISQQCGISTDIAQRGYCRREGYGLAMVWVHPYQARVSIIDDVVRELALLASSRPDWPYTFVQFNRDACHMPLPKEGHLSPMTEGTPSNIPCGKICQLEVHQFCIQRPE